MYVRLTVSNNTIDKLSSIVYNALDLRSLANRFIYKYSVGDEDRRAERCSKRSLGDAHINMTSKLQAWRTVKLELSKIAAGEPMTFTINNKDLPLLRERGFVSGASGQTWFNEDKEGKMWQAAEDDDGQLAFRKEISDKLWGVLTTISREQFDVLFPRENYPRTDTGE